MSRKGTAATCLCDLIDHRVVYEYGETTKRPNDWWVDLTIMSTKGTAATAHRNSSGRMLTALPISRPPALRPVMASLAGAVHPVVIRCSATSTK